MSIDKDTFGYLRPTDRQMEMMEELRQGAAQYARLIDIGVPEGPDKTFILRSLRTLAMWVNVAITREANGAPRTQS